MDEARKELLMTRVAVLGDDDAFKKAS